MNILHYVSMNIIDYETNILRISWEISISKYNHMDKY